MKTITLLLALTLSAFTHGQEFKPFEYTKGYDQVEQQNETKKEALERTVGATVRSLFVNDYINYMASPNYHEDRTEKEVEERIEREKWEKIRLEEEKRQQDIELNKLRMENIRLAVLEEEQRLNPVISFDKIDSALIFPRCKRVKTIDDRNKCSKEKIIEHNQKNFNQAVANGLGLYGMNVSN